MHLLIADTVTEYPRPSHYARDSHTSFPEGVLATAQRKVIRLSAFVVVRRPTIIRDKDDHCIIIYTKLFECVCDIPNSFV
mmetsp:Transcript_7248/g.26660  ORF Transcript_7248/g.26660 Transcript_7248/m.26660 type:complete len:80 (-) Transcript_7248:931-1170(-)